MSQTAGEYRAGRVVVIKTLVLVSMAIVVLFRWKDALYPCQSESPVQAVGVRVIDMSIEARTLIKAAALESGMTECQVGSLILRRDYACRLDEEAAQYCEAVESAFDVVGEANIGDVHDYIESFEPWKRDLINGIRDAVERGLLAYKENR